MYSPFPASVERFSPMPGPPSAAALPKPFGRVVAVSGAPMSIKQEVATSLALVIAGAALGLALGALLTGL